MPVELSEALLSKAAGWEAMKFARAYLAQGQVISSHWGAPLLRGVVQAGEMSFRASMVIKSDIDIENLCNCREAREWGKICPHSVAVGLHWLKSQQPNTKPAVPSTKQSASAPPVRSPSLKRDSSGEPAELFVILPPNLEQALARDKIMVVLEAKWAGGRCPLNALPKGRSFLFSPADERVLQQLETLSGGETPAVMQISASQLAQLLPALVEHPGLSLGKSVEVEVTTRPFSLNLSATLEPSGEILLSLKGSQAKPATVGNWSWIKPTFQPLNLPGLLDWIWQKPVRIARPDIPQFLSQNWPELSKMPGVQANFSLDDFTFAPQAPRFVLELRGGLAQLNGLLQCAYGSRVMTIGVTAADEALWLPDPQRPTRYSTRDLASERAALARLQRSGFSGPDVQGRIQLLGQNAVLNFLAREFPKLQAEWTVTLEERLARSTTEKLERIEPRLQITPSGVQWFDLGVVFESSGGESFSQAEIQRLLLSGQSHTRLKNGKTALIDTGAVEEFQEVLRDCAPQQHGLGYRIENQQAGFLESTFQQNPAWRVQAPSSWRQRASQTSAAKPECPPLGDLESVLRPYQKQGVAWLRFLRENQFSGILADEMGLGKTLQALAFLRHVRQIEPGAKPVLVVCPTSLVFNWRAEAERFTTSLKVLTLHGPERHQQFDDIPKTDLVITSYAVLRRDAERYRTLEFDTVVLDEAQHIKNRQTQNAQAVKSVRSSHRIVLTGTPLENSVFDLWSIFDFLMPGYLGTANDFKERYEQPIARDKDPKSQARLARRLRPFLLRRLKSEVAADLPAKLEQVSFCELASEQRQVYQQILEASRKEILEATGPEGLAKSRMLILTTLLRLRQVCCDLRLLQLPDVKPEMTSGKLDMFSELLEEIIDGGHRVLVFSQFVGMLTLLKERLAAEDVEFCYLDGATVDRAAVVSRFQSSSTIPVFLISLKAGGVGLNLTGADTVIHFDPWWNPAVEAQATDRAHRLGQTKVVTSYKLITRDTVEEKILLLQNRKRELIRATIGDDEEFAGALSWDEIQELLS